ncbi:MAG: hypothetical protein RQ899_14275 [Pseudomonadales bacterium]|nr:hypothetical protein [Pseudomonadales bacterium]
MHDDSSSQPFSQTNPDQETAAVMQQDESDRIIATAVRSAPLPSLEVDFALKLAKRIEAVPERACELYISALLFLALVTGGLLYGLPHLSELNSPLFLTVLIIVTILHCWDWRDRRKLPM